MCVAVCPEKKKVPSPQTCLQEMIERPVFHFCERVDCVMFVAGGIDRTDAKEKYKDK